MENDYRAPDPYQLRTLAAERLADAIAAMPKAEFAYWRRLELQGKATRAALDASAPTERRLTTAEELAKYTPPDPYAPGLARLRAQL